MRSNPELAQLAAKINQGTGVPLNREQRRAARHKRPAKAHQVDALAGLRVLDHVRTYEPGEMTAEHVKTRAAFELLRTGHGDEASFDRVSMILNVGLIRAEAIDESLVQSIQAGQQACVRMRDRFQQGFGFAFDEPGFVEVSEALLAYEAIMDASSPMQMKFAIREAYKRITSGDLLL